MASQHLLSVQSMVSITILFRPAGMALDYHLQLRELHSCSFWPALQSILNHTTSMTFQNANEATSHPCLESFRGFRGSPLPKVRIN